MTDLSARTRSQLEALFLSETIEEATRILIAGCTGSPNDERLRAAILRISAGDLGQLRDAVTLAKKDWRDALVAADFASDIQAHLHWEPRRLGLATLQRWSEGVNPPGVHYGPGASVQVRSPDLWNQLGTVQELLGIDPQPLYRVALAPDRIERLSQSALRPNPGA